jgi:hypothetical protein
MRAARVLLLVAFVIPLATGCTSYFQVTDPTTGRRYYTTGVDNKSSGAVQFQDARTGSKVTLQNSEVHQITRPEFDAGKAESGTRPPSP